MLKKLIALKWRLLPLAGAALILLTPIVGDYFNKHRISQAGQAAQTKLDRAHKSVKIAGQPSRILIPSLAIDLPVVSQHYSALTKTWPVAPSDANYASETAPINNSIGQTLIYGHDNRAVFGPLLNMPVGTVAYVYTSNGHIFKYSFTGFKDVSPQNVDIVSKMKDSPVGLNLITCTGDYFQYRHLMSLKLIQAT